MRKRLGRGPMLGANEKGGGKMGVEGGESEREAGEDVSRETVGSVEHVLGAELGVSRETIGRLETYVALLTHWNRAINLVSRRSLADVWRRHILDSAQLAPLFPTPAERRLHLADFGSGAGFPGLILAIMGIGHVHLVEVNQRKAAFLREAARRTDADVTVHACRVTALDVDGFDGVTARAFGPVNSLLDHALPLLGTGGVAIFPRGRGGQEELTQAQKTWNIRVEQWGSYTDPDSVIARIWPEDP